MPERPTGLPDLEELVTLARRFADRKRYDEAIELFQLALRLEPQDLGLRLAVARLRKLKRAQSHTSDKDPVEVARDELRRAAIDAAHFVGLAWLYAEKGEEYRALECLEIARAKDPISPAAYKLAGRLHYHLQDFDAAAGQLRKALRFNPFDREAAEMLGQVEYERRQYAEAMSATIDAVKMPVTAVRTKDAEITINVSSFNYPDVAKAPLAKGKVSAALQLPGGGEKVYTAVSKAAGTFVVTIPAKDLGALKAGSYTVVIMSSIGTESPSVSPETLVLF